MCLNVNNSNVILLWHFGFPGDGDTNILSMVVILLPREPECSSGSNVLKSYLWIGFLLFGGMFMIVSITNILLESGNLIFGCDFETSSYIRLIIHNFVIDLRKFYYIFYFFSFTISYYNFFSIYHVIQYIFTK